VSRSRFGIIRVRKTKIGVNSEGSDCYVPNAYDSSRVNVAELAVIFFKAVTLSFTGE
jgi:hypothetical protein